MQDQIHESPGTVATIDQWESAVRSVLGPLDSGLACAGVGS